MINFVPPVQVDISPFLPVEVNFSPDFAVDVQLGHAESKPYQGEYVFTPSDQEQTIQIQGKTAAQNIVIEAIPSNWGRIAWNGYAVTVY